MCLLFIKFDSTHYEHENSKQIYDSSDLNYAVDSHVYSWVSVYVVKTKRIVL